MSIEFISVILSVISGLVGLALVIADIDYAKRNKLPSRWIWSGESNYEEVLI